MERDGRLERLAAMQPTMPPGFNPRAATPQDRDPATGRFVPLGGAR